MQSLHEWDPLKESIDAPELLTASKKREIKNIIKSYTGWFDYLSELIQNSLDAVDDKKEAPSRKYSPKIWITINLKENLISVKDNGIGFSEEQLKYFIRPQISFKNIVKTRGNKGVGITYLAYGFNYLEFETKSKGFQFHGYIRNGRDWLEDDTNLIPRPLVKQLETSNEPKDIESGSNFILKIQGEHVRPRDLNWLGIEEANKWEKILRLATPLGGIYTDGKQNLECELIVISKNGKKTQKKIDDCTYLYPHIIFQHCQKLSDIKNEQKKLIDDGKDSRDLPARFKKLNGIYEQWDSNTFFENGGPVIQLSVEQKNLLKNQKVMIYGFLSFSVRLFDIFNQDVLNLKYGIKLLKSGFQIATRMMPQGSIHAIELIQSIGYQKSSHIVIHFNDVDPDLGRKGFQPEIIELAGLISSAVVLHLKKWNYLLAGDSGSPVDLSLDSERYNWIRLQEEHEKKNPLTIRNQHFFLPMKKIAILSVPISEQDVIILFNQLIAGGVIRGIRILSTSQSQQYDGGCRIIIDKPLKNHKYHEKHNPLGIKKLDLTEFTSHPRILEYKYNFDALIDEFDRGDKTEKNIDMVVCWDLGTKWRDRYSVTSLLIKENIHLRHFHGVTHLVKNLNSENNLFDLVVLKDLITCLNDPTRSEREQKEIFEP